MDLKVEVVSTAADNAVGKVSYGSNGKPEPGIRPWPGAPNWQSPDIEIRNDKATADPGKYFNTPWLGHDNKVIAKVRNSGDLLAKGVVVDFFVAEYSSGDGPWASLGFDTREWPLVADVSERRLPKRLWERPNRLSTSGYAARPFRADCRALTLTGGVGMRVDAGRATAIKMRAASPRYVAGALSIVDNGAPVTAGGKVLIEMIGLGDAYFTLTDQVEANGSFSIREFDNRFGETTRALEVHYLGASGAAPCTTGRIAIR